MANEEISESGKLECLGESYGQYCVILGSIAFRGLLPNHKRKRHIHACTPHLVVNLYIVIVLFFYRTLVTF